MKKECSIIAPAILRTACTPRAPCPMECGKVFELAERRGTLFASSVSLTSSRIRAEVPEKTKVATSISRSIPFRPVPSKPHVSGRNADASKSGRILRFSRRSTGREKPPRPSAATMLPVPIPISSWKLTTMELDIFTLAAKAPQIFWIFWYNVCHSDWRKAICQN